MVKILKIMGDDVLAPTMRTACIFLLPLIAFVQFFFPYSLAIAIPIAVVLLVVGAVGFTAHYEYKYNAEKNLFSKSLVLLGFSSDNWYEINPQSQYLSFQMFKQTFTFNFLNIYSTGIEENVFSIRAVNSDATYRTLVETTDYKSIPQCLQLCQILSEKHNVPFKDFVKEQVKKMSRKM